MWAALQFSEKERPSSILLTVLAGKAYKTVDLGSLNGDDQVLEAIVENILEQLKRSRIVKNPTNDDENLNRLSDRDNDSLAFKLEELLTIADRALAAPTKLASAEIWSEAFYHFFPVPAATDDEMKTSKLTEDRSLVAAFDPIIAVRATGGGKSYEGTNRIGPIPRGCEIIFTLANAHMLPSGSTVHWMVRNAGREAETENDLGHRAGQGFNAKENSAYRGSHFMDVAVKRDGLLIGTRRVSVQITGLGIPLRNPPRPAWTKLRSRNR
jgi:hypothetical protein